MDIFRLSPYLVEHKASYNTRPMQSAPKSLDISCPILFGYPYESTTRVIGAVGFRRDKGVRNGVPWNSKFNSHITLANSKSKRGRGEALG